MGINWATVTNEPTAEKDTCDGLYFRAEVSEYLSGNGDINFRQRMRPLKRLSCTGCGVCWDIMDCLNEQIGPYMDASAFPENVETGHVYKLDFVNITTDWETGIVDGYDIMFVHVPCNGEHFREEGLDLSCKNPYKHKGSHKSGVIKWEVE